MLELNTIYHADVFDYLAALEDNSIDLAIADPPYNMRKAAWDTFRNDEEYFGFMESWLNMLMPKLKSAASLYLFNTAFNSAVILNYLRSTDLKFRSWITWYKKDGCSAAKRKYVNAQETILFYTVSDDYTFNCDAVRQPYDHPERLKSAETTGILKNGKRWYPNPNGKLCTDVWEITSQRHKVKQHGKVMKPAHPTTKPEELIERIIKASSNPGDTILDLFSGSGMTSLTAQKLGRQFTGCENNAEYIDNIVRQGIKTAELPAGSTEAEH